jgi:Na+/proline symporter
MIRLKTTGEGDITYNDAMLLMIRDILPNGLLGVAVAGLWPRSWRAWRPTSLRSTPCSATTSGRTTWSRTGPTATTSGWPDRHIAATILAIFTALIAAGYSNLMDYLQTLFGFFNAPLFATFILGMFWKRMTSTAGWAGLVCGTLSAIFVFILSKVGVISLPGQGVPFVAASVAFVVDILVSVAVTMVTTPKPANELVGLVYSETSKDVFSDPESAGKAWYYKPVPLAAVSLALVIVLNIVFH